MFKVGISYEEAKENLRVLFDTFNHGPMAQERERIKKLRHQGMLLQDHIVDANEKEE